MQKACKDLVKKPGPFQKYHRPQVIIAAVMADIGCFTASGKSLLPWLIARFRKEYPRVKINVVIGTRESIITKRLAGDVSLGVSSKWIEHYDLEYREFFNDDVILIVPAPHRWAKFRRIYPDDLRDEPLILREELAGTHEVLIERLRHMISHPKC